LFHDTILDKVPFSRDTDRAHPAMMGRMTQGQSGQDPKESKVERTKDRQQWNITF
jgi:hypothetical protein